MVYATAPCEPYLAEISSANRANAASPFHRGKVVAFETVLGRSGRRCYRLTIADITLRRGTAAYTRRAGEGTSKAESRRVEQIYGTRLFASLPSDR
jgi:flagellar basal body rod protein FlgB